MVYRPTPPAPGQDPNASSRGITTHSAAEPSITVKPTSTPTAVQVHSTLRVDVHLGGAAAMPRRQQHAAAPALVRNVLEAVHDVRDAAQTAEAAEAEGPGAVKC